MTVLMERGQTSWIVREGGEEEGGTERTERERERERDYIFIFLKYIFGGRCVRERECVS